MHGSIDTVETIRKNITTCTCGHHNWHISHKYHSVYMCAVNTSDTICTNITTCTCVPSSQFTQFTQIPHRECVPSTQLTQFTQISQPTNVCRRHNSHNSHKYHSLHMCSVDTMDTIRTTITMCTCVLLIQLTQFAKIAQLEDVCGRLNWHNSHKYPNVYICAVDTIDTIRIHI